MADSTKSFFQVFAKDHPFEVYDFVMKDEFWFEKAAGASIPTLPLTLVWGVIPRDSGDPLNPYSKVTLDFDPTLNVSSPRAQRWLLRFCQALRSTTLYQRTSGLQLTNCYIENFRRFMQRGCEGVNGEDHAPCCRASHFPFSSRVFQKCIRVYRSVLAQTRDLYFSNSQAGLRYSKETGNIVALIVEFNSRQPFSFSYESTREFYAHMENWTSTYLRSAPVGLRQGWFVSYLEFYDLQNSIAHGTLLAIGVAIAVATVVAFLTTLNVLITLHAMISIAGCIFTTVAILVLLGWELNILESVTISIAVGLSIDFTLHYAMAYRLAPHLERELRVLTSLSRMGSPVAMAALTTFLAGLVMMPSTVLAYRKLGTFLMVIMSMSWAFATFFFQSLLRILGPPGGFGQFHWPSCDCIDSDRDHVDKTVYTMSESTVSSLGGNHGRGAEMHELEPLTSSERSEGPRGNYRHPKPSRYHHRLSVGSTSSAGSESSPRSRRFMTSPEEAADPNESPTHFAKCSPDISLGSTEEPKRPGILKDTRSSVTKSRERNLADAAAKIRGPQPRLSDSDYVSGDVSSNAGCIKKHSVVSLGASDGGFSDSRPRVEVLTNTEPGNGAPALFASTGVIRGSGAKPEPLNLPVIPTDSNSNRTDVHTDKHADAPSIAAMVAEVKPV